MRFSKHGSPRADEPREEGEAEESTRKFPMRGGQNMRSERGFVARASSSTKIERELCQY